VQDLRQAQDHLGELHDLQVLNQIFVEREHLRQPSAVPVLHAELEGQQQLHWLRWRELAQRLHQDCARQTIQRHLLALGSGPRPASG
jgi:hypothetical protein